MLRRHLVKTTKHSKFSLGFRFNSTKQEKIKITIEDPDIFNASESPISDKPTQLNFAYRATGEAFGQLVNEVHHERDPLHNTRVVSQTEALEGVDPRYRDQETGELLEAATSREARLHPETLWGRHNQKQIIIPEILTDVIQNNILFQYEPKALKQYVSEWYTEINEKGIRDITESELSADVSIAASFAQDYASAHQVINEFVKRVGKDTVERDVKSVLDVGLGPSVGMLAMNDIMGAEWNPERKDVYVAGDFNMSRKAKILLSRQVNENLPRGPKAETHQEEAAKNVTRDAREKVSDSASKENFEATNEERYVGRVKTKLLKIKSVLLDKLRPQDIKYDLIIVSYQLLRSLENFPFEVDAKLEEYVKRLNPGGYLLLVERGSPIGAETIARARQIMLRPEKYENQFDKFPRPFKSSAKKFSAKEELKLFKLTPEEKALAMKNIEPELLENFDIVEEEQELEELEKLDEQIDLSVIAPCSHHGPCPLQFFEPEVYLYGQIGKKLKFCNYSIKVARPRYLLELKRGKKLSTKWTSANSGIGIDGLSKGGKGREGGNDYETASYSYLIVQRSKEDPQALEKQRQTILEDLQAERAIGFKSEKREEYPRILAPPLKKKGFVIMDVCAPSGHVEKWHISKSVGKEEYHDARKANMGDLWALGYKSANQSKKENIFYFERIEEKKKNLRMQKKRDSNKLKRQIANDYKKAMEVDPEERENNITHMARIDSFEFLNKPKEAQKLKEKKKYKF